MYECFYCSQSSEILFDLQIFFVNMLFFVNLLKHKYNSHLNCFKKHKFTLFGQIYRLIRQLVFVLLGPKDKHELLPNKKISAHTIRGWTVGPEWGTVILPTNLWYCPWRFVGIDLHTLWKFSSGGPPIMIDIPIVKHCKSPMPTNHHT